MIPSERDRHDRFLRLYIEQEEALRGFARSLVPTREDAREVMQEAASVLWRKFEEITSKKDFRRWAFGVVRFEALTYLRGQRRDRHVFSDALLERLAEEAEAAEEEWEAERRALDLCLKKLPEAQRTLVEAAYAPGVRMDHFAQDAGRSAMSIYKALHRIRLTLLACTKQTLAREDAP